MQQKQKHVPPVEIAGHVATGACLGTFLALTLIVSNTARVFDMIAGAPAPAMSAAVFVGVFAAVFAVGATLTGLLFSLMERD
jgi:tetrahydromethanopterin S-methyltransferase subunit D